MSKEIESNIIKSMIEDSNKIIEILSKKRIIRRQFYLKTSPFVYFGILTKNGFQVFPHKFSDYGKISISLRKTIKNQNVHVLLRSTKQNKHWLKIHADVGIKDHKVLKLSSSTTEVIIEMINSDILFATRNPNWLNEQNVLYNNHKSKEYLESKKDRYSKKIRYIANIENKEWLTTHEKDILEKRKDRAKKKLK